MENFAAEDEGVRITLGKEKLAGTAKTAKSGNEEDLEWVRLLEVDGKGNYMPSIDNLVIILDNDPRLKGNIAINEFSSRNMVIGDLPWHRLENSKNGDVWGDGDDASLRHYIEKVYRISHRRNLEDALLIIRERNKYHPVRNYLDSLSWDGIERVERMFVDYLGTEDSLYSRTVTRKMLAAACARVFQPGIKFDYMLVLTGGQGLGKSQVLRLLGKSWFSDSVMSIQGKEAVEQLQGVWILEMGELAATRKADVEHVKQYISKCEDYFRKAYGRNPEVYYRQCVLFGTTNNMEFLRDQTGNRRFWPLEVGFDESKKNKWKELSPEYIDQVWAEACQFYKNGEELYLSEELEKEAILKQELHTESSMDEGIIQNYLDMLLPEDWDDMDLNDRRQYIHGGEFKEKKKGTVARNMVCAMEIWMERMNGSLNDPWKNSRTREIHAILGKLEGWRPYSRGTGKRSFGKLYGNQKGYIRADGKEA